MVVLPYPMEKRVGMKPVRWMGNSLDVLRNFPREARREIGFALDKAQRGGMHSAAKPLRGFGGAGVLEIVEDHRTDTYRAVYTVRFAKAVYVLHCFKKKSSSGIKTPRRDRELIQARLKNANEEYKLWLKEGSD